LVEALLGTEPESKKDLESFWSMKMARRACTFKKRDLMEMLKAAKAAGYDGARVEIDLGDGRKMILVAQNAEPPRETKDIVL
jgi:hypothetical protein